MEITLLKPELSILIVHFNTPNLLPQMFACLFAALKRPGRTEITHEIIFLDNASKESCRTVVAQCAPSALYIQNKNNVGFGRANNQAILQASGDFVLLLNTDAFVSPNSIELTLEFIKRDAGCGVLGVRLADRDGGLQPSCRYFPTPWNTFLQRSGLKRYFPHVRLVDDLSWDHASIRACDWVPGCYYLVRRSVIDQVGLFDPRYFLYFEEVDHCRAVKAAGWQVVFFGETTVVHLGGESAKADGPVSRVGQQVLALHLESELLYIRKHFGLLGLLFHLLLNQVLAFAISIKGLFFGANARRDGSVWPEVKLRWRLLFRTSFAKLPTR